MGTLADLDKLARKIQEATDLLKELQAVADEINNLGRHFRLTGNIISVNVRLGTKPPFSPEEE